MSRISIPKNCSLDVRLAIQQIAAKLHEKKSPTFAGLNLSGLTASRLIQTNISKVLSSVTDLTSWIAGTANQISVADDADGTVTLAIINPLKLSYDATNYITFAVQSDGDLTLDSNKVSYDLNFVDGNLLTTGTLGAGAITTEGKITVTGGGETGTFQTGLGRYTVLAYTGLGLDIRAGNGNNASQNVMRVDNSGNFDFYSGNLVTLGTLGAGVTTIESTTTPQLTIKYDASNLGSIEIVSGGDMYLRGGTDFGFIGTDGSGAAVLLYDDTQIVARLGHSGYPSGNCAFYNYVGDFHIRNVADEDVLFYTNNTLRMVIRNAGNVGINENAPQDTLEVNGTGLFKDKLKFTQDDGNEYIDSLADGYLDIGATTAVRLKPVTIAEDAIYFTQTDGVEKIDSDADGYLDLYAGTEVRVHNYIRHSSSNYRRYYHLSVGGFDPGASGATWIDPNANHSGGWRLNAEAEVLIAGTDIHADWDGVSDITVEIKFALNAAGVGDNVVDLNLVAYYNGIGDTATKTQTVEVPTTTDGTQYKVYKATFTLDYDAGGNVIDVGDEITFILNLLDTSDPFDVIIIGGTFFYNTTHIGIESGDT